MYNYLPWRQVRSLTVRVAELEQLKEAERVTEEAFRDM